MQLSLHCRRSDALRLSLLDAFASQADRHRRQAQQQQDQSSKQMRSEEARNALLEQTLKLATGGDSVGNPAILNARIPQIMPAMFHWCGTHRIPPTPDELPSPLHHFLTHSTDL
jgi:hypothetical protein